jgi:repressor of nif and glnA expression
MARQKKLTEDQIEQLDSYTSDFVIASEELRAYLNDIIAKSNDGYVIVNAIKLQMEGLEDIISKLSEVVETNKWELYDNIDIDDSDEGDDVDDE